MISSVETLRALGPSIPSDGLEIAPNPLRELVLVQAIRPGLYRVSLLCAAAWVEAEDESKARSRVADTFWRIGMRPGMTEEEACQILGRAHPAMGMADRSTSSQPKEHHGP